MSLPNLMCLLLVAVLLLPASSVTLAFGSCNQFYPTHSTEIYTKIAEFHPSHFLFLGDAFYLDRFVFPGPPTVWRPLMDEDEIRRRIRGFLSDPNFSILKNASKIEYVWDDHDYNMNNGGSDNPVKDMMRRIYIEEMGLQLPLAQSLSRVVEVHDNLKVVLLDVRSERTPQQMFGEGTWQWIEALFQKAKPQELYIIGGGIQFIYDDRPATEKWDVQSRLRFFQLLYKYKIHAILISGDVHYGEIGKREGIYEVTSSGLTFSGKDHFLGAEGLLKYFVPQTYSKSADRYVAQNFGLLHINYDPSNSTSILSVDLQVKTLNGSTAISYRVPFEETVMQTIDEMDLGHHHMDLFYKYAFLQALRNPLMLAYCLPMGTVVLLGLWTLWQLRRLNID